MNIITRKEAIVNNLKHYYTGKPCPKGHDSERAVYNCTCCVCNNESRIKAEKKKPRDRSNYYKANKEKILAYRKEYRINNKSLYAAHSAKRRAKKLQRTPSWSDLKAITEFYKACPEGMVVDHIIPLQGKNVSGFHVLENLQYLTREENGKKYNNF